SKGSLEWGSNGEGTFPKYRTPREGVFLRYYKAGQRGETFLINEIDENACPAHYDYLCTLPGVGEQLLKMKDAGIPFPKSQIDHVAYFKYGYVLFITYEPVPESHDIFKRFAKVFEQTYTRFLDLQKAEAQAREAQIEVALERVRARTMAMHKSQELKEVVSVMYNEMELLGLAKWGCNIMIFHEESTQIEFWLAEETDTDHTGNYFAKGKEHPVYRKLWNHWKKQGPPLTLHHQDAYKREFDEYWLSKTDFKYLPEVVKKSVFDRNEVFLNYATMQYGMLNAISYVPINHEMLEILARFAKVFEQAYTRFLDLQKAEAQAREAQIEAALEKVRSRSLAMHKPDELQEVITVVAEKLQELGVIFDVGGVILCTYFPDNKDVVHWIASPDLSSSQSYLVPYFDNPIFSESWESKNRGDNYFSKEFTVEAKNHFFEYAFEHSDYKHFPEDYKQHVLEADKHTLSAAWSKNSAIIIPSLTGVVPSESDADIMKRFAKVFEQAYIRFLDLQKAEAQTREAQIEAALERVRSKTMAMHNSEDLEGIVISLFKEVMDLGLDKAMRCGIGILEGHEGMETRSVNFNTDGTIELKVGMLNMTIHPMLVGLKKAWKNGSKRYSYYYSTKDVRTYYEALNNEPEYPFNANLETLPEQEFHQSFFYSSGIIFAFSKNPIAEESSKILARFAAVFGQTYRRFLDLQKAEAQAREAQIEAALERVRSRSMAMHKSKEMLAVIGVVSEQLQQLNLNFDTVSFAKNNQEGDFTFWITSRGQEKPLLMQVPTFESPVLKGVYKAQKKGIAFLADVFSAEVNREW
ncbi:MAG: hypothetical protein KJO63_01650, partial [Maribacter sp.]|nr:hypothetical protein [Maribacter sp.]